MCKSTRDCNLTAHPEQRIRTFHGIEHEPRQTWLDPLLPRRSCFVFMTACGCRRSHRYPLQVSLPHALRGYHSFKAMRSTISSLSQHQQDGYQVTKHSAPSSLLPHSFVPTP